MKNSFKHFIVLKIALLLSLIISSPIYANNEVYIEADELLVRSGPGTTYEPIGHVNSGEVFTYLREEDGWTTIDYNGETGWVSSQHVTINQQQVQQQFDHVEGEPGTETTAIIPYDLVNLRSEPSTDGEIIAEIPIGELVSVQLKDNSDWAQVTWNEKTGYLPQWIIKQEKTNNTLSESVFSDKVIVIDPGHGGVDIGAIGVSGQFESHYALYTSLVLQDYLETLGATVYLTRDDDYYYALTPRASVANYYHADVFLSIHYNSTPQFPTANGIDTFYHHEKDQGLAYFVHDALINETGANDRGVERANYQVLRTSKQPGLLLELGFISHAEEERNIQSHNYQAKMSRGIISGLGQYFSQ